jgi:hypothetical protein
VEVSKKITQAPFAVKRGGGLLPPRGIMLLINVQKREDDTSSKDNECESTCG